MTGLGETVGSDEAGLVLGVEPRTVRRWADAGVLPVAYRTVGGHRRFRCEDVAALRKRLEDGGTS